MKYLLLILILFLAGCSTCLTTSTVGREEIITRYRVVEPEKSKNRDTHTVQVMSRPAPAAAPVPSPIESSPMPPRVDIIPGTTSTSQINSNSISNQMYQANMVYSVPNSANISEKVKIQLLIDPNRGMSSLLDALSFDGAKTGKTVKVSKIMIAKITAPQFDVSNITPDEQVLSQTDPTEWQWSLQPKSAGKHEISITLTALLDVDNKSAKQHIKTYEAIISVEVTPNQIFADWFSKYWQWLITTFLLPLGLWIYKSKKRDSQ